MSVLGPTTTSLDIDAMIETGEDLYRAALDGRVKLDQPDALAAWFAARGAASVDDGAVDHARRKWLRARRLGRLAALSGLVLLPPAVALLGIRPATAAAPGPEPSILGDVLVTLVPFGLFLGWLFLANWIVPAPRKPADDSAALGDTTGWTGGDHG